MAGARGESGLGGIHRRVRNRAEGWSAAAQQAVVLPAMLQDWPFRDAVPKEYEVHVKVLLAAQVVQGFPDQRFGGDEPVTRAQMVAMLQRIGPVAALKQGAVTGAPPTDATHGRVTEVRIAVNGSVVNAIGYEWRPLRGDRPSDWPAIGRLLTALDSAKEEPVPDWMRHDGSPPPFPLKIPFRLQIEFADGYVEDIVPFLRCQRRADGATECDNEPGWVVALGRVLHSTALWETVNGQLKFDMPQLRK